MLVRRALMALLLGATLLPAVSGRDGFPFSTQPMYAQVRAPTASFVSAVGRSPDGATVELATSVLASTDDPLVAQRRLTDGASRDPDGVCADVRRRAPVELTVIEVRRVTVDLDAPVGAAPLDVEVLATC